MPMHRVRTRLLKSISTKFLIKSKLKSITFSTVRILHVMSAIESFASPWK